MVLTKDELVALLAMVSHKLISAREYAGVDLGALALKLAMVGGQLCMIPPSPPHAHSLS